MVIALTHMRWPSDRQLAESVPEIDLFLGGHDHDYGTAFINNRWVIKSGTDFRELSLIQISKSGLVKKIEKYSTTAAIKENEEIKSIVNRYLKDITGELEIVLGYMNVELEGRFSYIRTQETNLGNFVCDILMNAVCVFCLCCFSVLINSFKFNFTKKVRSDCAIVNSGTFRSDFLHQKGDFKVKDLKKILPYIDNMLVVSVRGDQLLKVLENSVSLYPRHEGRFIQISGLKFAFDPSKPSGQRVDPRLVRFVELDEPLSLDKEYSLATTTYLRSGKDGFDVLAECPQIIEDEMIPDLFSMVVNHFKSIENLKHGLKRFR